MGTRDFIFNNPLVIGLYLLRNCCFKILKATTKRNKQLGLVHNCPKNRDKTPSS